MVDIDLVIGGHFEKHSEDISSDQAGFGFIKLQNQQLYNILKFLDYSQNYTKFQTGILTPFFEKKFEDIKLRDEYMDTYEDFKRSENPNASRSDKRKLPQHKAKLGRYF